MADASVKDMTKGSPAKLLVSFALPLMAGNLFQQFYTFADTVVVGRVLGMDALAAMGAAEWMVFLMFGAVQGLVQGFSVTIAQRFGGNDDTGLKESATAAVFLSIAAAFLLLITGQWMVQPMLCLLRTPEEIIGITALYLRILYGGVPITMAYHLLSALLRALGNSRTPLQAMTAASLCNILLDVLFVYELGWGIGGAAYATLLAQLLAAALCFWEWKKISVLHIPLKNFYLKKGILLEELRMGIPMGFQNIITAGGGLIVQSVVNGFGVLFLAGYTAAVKLYALLEIAASSYGYAMATYAGQNRGAELFGRIKKGLKAAIIIGTATAALMSAIMVLLGKPILACFLKGNTASVELATGIGYRFLLILSIFFPLLYILYILRACIQGMGNSLIPMLSSLAQLSMRCACAIFLTKIIGETGIFYGEILAWIGADIMLALWLFLTIENCKTQ